MNQALLTAADLNAVMASVNATGLLSGLCTIQSPSGVFGPSGAPDGVWANVSGLVNIPCQVSVLSGGMPVGGTEIKMAPEILSKQPLHVLLNANYPTITTKMRAVINGSPADIESVEHDSQAKMTRLLVTRNSI